MVGDEEIEQLARSGTIDAIADALLARALEQGARDNVTLILVSAEAA